MELKKIKEAAEIRTSRAEKLRTIILNTVPEISSERVRYYTESYRANDFEPIIIKRAKALKNMLENMSLYVLDGELIVGNTAQKPRGVELFPEFEVTWIERELEGDPYHFHERPGDRFVIDDKTKKELVELLPYWHGKTHCERVKSILPEATKKAWEMEAIDGYWLMQGGDGHITINFKTVLTKGIEKIKEEINEELNKLNHFEPETVPKINFYRAALISLEAFIKYAVRYSNYVKKCAENEKDSKRKIELETVSKICARVPRYPVESFHEALQAIWFIHAAIHIENNGHSISLGRFDQTLYPYFQMDLESERLTVEGAAELLQCFWLKLFTINKIRDWNSTQFFSGYQVFQNITFGGQLHGGKDGANELSFLFLGVQKAVRLIAPSMSVRFHDGISEEFLQAVIDVIRQGGGQPALYSDETMIPALINRGISYEDAVNYSIVGCVEPIIEGKQAYRPNGASFINMLKILEIALHGGKDPRTGHILLPLYKNLASFSSFDEVLEAWEKEASFFIEQQVTKDNFIDTSMEELIPNPFISCFVDDCIKRGKTIKQGGAVYDYCGPLLVGLANVGDSLASIKKVIFEDGKLTGKQLLHAIDTDFNDQTTVPTGEEIRKMLLDAPKYGNDDDYVDTLTAGALELFCNKLPEYKVTRYGKGPKGCFWQASTSSVSGNVPFGLFIGATPDGRKANEPTADTTSPTHGLDRDGPLSTMKSVAKLPNVLSSGGNLFNMKFSPLVLQDEISRRKFSMLIRTFLGDLKGMHVQFNIVKKDTLLDAKKSPEKYRDLMVRVAGYSALFTSLDPKLQDDIIERTEQATV